MWLQGWYNACFGGFVVAQTVISAWCGLVLAVPTEISDVLLGFDEWQCGGPPISLIKEAVLGFFSRQDDVLLVGCPV
jgi:hypothetical protein